MSHKLSELEKRISVWSVPSRKKGDSYFAAECPICGYTHKVDILGSDAVAEAHARQNVVAHIKWKHAAEIDAEA